MTVQVRSNRPVDCAGKITNFVTGNTSPLGLELELTLKKLSRNKSSWLSASRAKSGWAYIVNGFQRTLDFHRINYNIIFLKVCPSYHSWCLTVILFPQNLQTEQNWFINIYMHACSYRCMYGCLKTSVEWLTSTFHKK